MGWAILHVTGTEKDGNARDWLGWFLPKAVEYPNLLIGSSCTIS